MKTNNNVYQCALSQCHNFVERYVKLHSSDIETTRPNTSLTEDSEEICSQVW